MLAMLNPGLVWATADAEKSGNSKIYRTLKFYYPYLRQWPE
jgi:hypothetical protein